MGYLVLETLETPAKRTTKPGLGLFRGSNDYSASGPTPMLVKTANDWRLIRAAALWAAAFVIGYVSASMFYHPSLELLNRSKNHEREFKTKTGRDDRIASLISLDLKNLDFDDLNLFIRTLAAHDPKGALRWAKQNKLLNPNLERSVFLVWLQNDPSSAIAWAIANNKDFLAESALYKTLGQSGQLSLAFTALDSIDNPQIRAILLRDLASVAASAQLAVYANSRPAAERIIINTAVAQTMAATGDPQTAVNWAHQTAQNQTELAELLGGVVSGWLTNGDSAALLAWVNSQPAGPEMDKAYALLADGLATTDSDSTFANLQKIADQKLQDTAAIFAMHDVRDTSPQTAIEYLSVIQDPSYRDSKINMVLQDWLIKDPDSANAYIATSPTISNNLKAKILNANNQNVQSQASPISNPPG